MSYLDTLGIDELYKQREIADRHNDRKLMEAIDSVLEQRDTDGYEQRQAESRFGA